MISACHVILCTTWVELSYANALKFASGQSYRYKSYAGDKHNDSQVAKLLCLDSSWNILRVAYFRVLLALVYVRVCTYYCTYAAENCWKRGNWEYLLDLGAIHKYEYAVRPVRL